MKTEMAFVTDEQIAELLDEIYELGLAKPDEQIAAVRRWVERINDSIMSAVTIISAPQYPLDGWLIRSIGTDRRVAIVCAPQKLLDAAQAYMKEQREAQIGGGGREE